MLLDDLIGVILSSSQFLSDLNKTCANSLISM